MRAWLASWGIKFRRFPVWLHIFNALCASGALALMLAGVYFLSPRDAPRPILAEGRLDGGALIAALESGGAADARDQVLSLPAAARAEVFRDIAALCDARAAALTLELLPAVPEEAGARARRRWTRVFGGMKEAWGASRLRAALAERSPSEVRSAALRESLLYGGALERRAAVAELRARPGHGDAVFRAAARRLPAELRLAVTSSSAPSIVLEAADEARLVDALRSGDRARARRALDALVVGELAEGSRSFAALSKEAARALTALSADERGRILARARGAFWAATQAPAGG